MSEPFSFSAPVVCGVDFSTHSRRALAIAARAAARLGQPLIIVSALDPLLVEAAELRYGPGRLAEDARRDLDALAQEVLTLEERKAAQATTSVVVGDPGAALLAAADKAQASIVVVGTQGLGRAERLLFGSTTLSVMRASTRPVLAVPPAAKATPGNPVDMVPLIRRIVCGVDFSDASASAARAAISLGSIMAVPVTLLHSAAMVSAPSTWDEIARAAHERRLADAGGRLEALARSFGDPAPGFEVRAGDPATTLAEEASSGEPALIVVGLRGASGHRPGSTASRVISEARMPVLAVP